MNNELTNSMKKIAVLEIKGGLESIHLNCLIFENKNFKVYALTISTQNKQIVQYRLIKKFIS